MTERSDLGATLAAAAALVRGRLAADLTGDARYQAHMVARLLDIGARELASEDAVADHSLALYRALYGADLPGATRAERVAEMNRHLVRDIRAGILEGACARAVTVLLRAQVEAKLRITNPRYLDRFGERDASGGDPR